MIKFVILVMPYMSMLIIGLLEFIHRHIGKNPNYDNGKIYSIYIFFDVTIMLVMKFIFMLSYIGTIFLMVVFAKGNFQKQYFVFTVFIILSHILLIFLVYNRTEKYIGEHHKFLLSVLYAIYYSITMFVVQLYYQTSCDNKVYTYIVGEVLSFFDVYKIQLILLLLILISFPKEDVGLFFFSNLMSIAIYLMIDETFGIGIHIFIVVIKLIYITIGKDMKVDSLQKITLIPPTYAIYLNFQFYIFEKIYKGGYFIEVCKNYYRENNDFIKDLIVIFITGVITLFLNNLKEKENS